MSEVPEVLSVIVPCFNERGAIGGVVDRLREVLDGIDAPSEVIVVDDGSTDGSAEVLADSPATVLRHPVNAGYGAALKTGAREARYSCIVITDADGTYPNEKIPALFKALSDCEMAVGARTGNDVQIPLVRRPAKWAITALARYLTGYPIPDLNSGLRAVRRSLWDRYEVFFPNGFSLTTTITVASLVNGHRVRFIPIDYHDRVGRSKIRPVRDTLNFIQLILRTIVYFNPMKVFVPFGVGFIGLGVGIGVVTLALQNLCGVGRFLDITTLLLCLTGVQLIAMGALADLITKRLS